MIRCSSTRSKKPSGVNDVHHVERTARQQHGRDERHRSVRQRRRDRDSQVVGELPFRHLDPGHRLPHAMRHQHTLRPAGGATGVDDGAQIIEADIGRFERRRHELVGECRIVVADVVRSEAEQREIRVLSLELAGASGEVVGVEDQAFDLRVTDHVRMVGERAHRVQRGDHTAVDERGRQIGQHLRPVLRQHGEARPARHAASPLRLDQLARPPSNVRVRRNPPGHVDARSVVVRGEAADDQVGKQRLIVEQRGHLARLVCRHSMFPVATCAEPCVHRTRGLVTVGLRCHREQTMGRRPRRGRRSARHWRFW